MKYVDFHAHLPNHPEAAARLIATLNGLGIDKAVVIAGGTLSPQDISRQIALGESSAVDVENEALLKTCRTSANRLLPFFFANPHRGAGPYAKIGKSFFGLKLGPAVHGVSFADRRTRELAEVAETFGHPVYLHCLARDGFRVPDLVELAVRFPRVAFVLGHSGVGNFDLYAVECIRPHSNIYFETSGGFSSVARAAVEKLGASRVLFGSEYPLQDPYLEIEKLRRLGLGSDDLALILGGNAARLLELGALA